MSISTYHFQHSWEPIEENAKLLKTLLPTEQPCFIHRHVVTNDHRGIVGLHTLRENGFGQDARRAISCKGCQGCASGVGSWPQFSDQCSSSPVMDVEETQETFFHWSSKHPVPPYHWVSSSPVSPGRFLVPKRFRGGEGAATSQRGGAQLYQFRCLAAARGSHGGKSQHRAPWRS